MLTITLELFVLRCSIIVSVRETCADWHFGVEPLGDPALKGKKDPDNGFGIKVPRRNVGEQFFRLNNFMVHSLFALKFIV